MAQLARYVETPHWRLRIPTVEPLHRTVCIPTIHPIGDQRVLRCAQAVLDAGYDVHFIWLGGDVGESRHHPRIRETRLRAAAAFRYRIRSIPRIMVYAWRVKPDVIHIHDFYLLPLARLWTRRTSRPVIYDVHEYYPEYYSHRGSIPPRLQGLVQGALARVERGLTAGIGGVNAVSEQLSGRLQGARTPAICTPNYPGADAFGSANRPLTPALLRRVVHIGTLEPSYGSTVLVETARRLAELAPEVELVAITRFHSDAGRQRFMGRLEDLGAPANLSLVEPMAAHHIEDLLRTCGIGLSLLQDIGQYPLAVPTKLYEYTRVGLAIVASDLPATREFVTRSAVCRLVPPASARAYAEAIVELIDDAAVTCAKVNAAADAARNSLSWDDVCAPRIRSLFHQVASVEVTTSAFESNGLLTDAR